MHEIAHADVAGCKHTTRRCDLQSDDAWGFCTSDLVDAVLLPIKLEARLVGVGDYWWLELSAFADIESPTRVHDGY